jgi:hypothetical protein
MIKAWRHRKQLLFYCLLVNKSDRFKSNQAAEAQMIYLETDKPDKMTLRYQPTSDELSRLEKLIQAAWQHVMALSFPDISKYSPDIAGIQQFEQDLIDDKI